jgi:hypothetical protein
MKSMVKILLGVVAGAMVLAVASPPALAQCGAGPRVFASIGGAGTDNKFRLNPGASNGVLGQEFGRFWQCSNSNEGNNFTPGDPARKMWTGCGAADPGCCPTQGGTQAGGGWWQIAQTTQRGINGIIAGTGCIASTCPSTDLCVVVEDWESPGPPGVGKGAYFVGFRVLETPATLRWWDLSRQCGTPGSGAQCEATMQQFPVPKITSATKAGVARQIVTDSNTDPAINVYVHTPNVGPASALVASYDLMVHYGTGDPGRDRNSGAWSMLAQIPYTDAALSNAPVQVPCDQGLSDAYLAFGLTFVGGPPGGPVPSQLVGAAIQVECGGDIAEPKPKKSVRVDERPGRTTPPRSGR